MSAITARRANISTVTFDLFGTLLAIDEGRLPEIIVDGQRIRSLLAAPISQLSKCAPQADLAEFLVGYSLASAHAKNNFEQGDNRELPPEWVFSQTLQRAANSDAALARSLAGSLMEATIEAAILVEGAFALLQGLRQRGFPLGLISNLADPQSGRRLLCHVGIASMFDVVVFSGDVSFRKPDARIFASALQQLGLPPSAAAHVGDEIDADVEGAGRAGLSAIWINPHRTPYEGDFPPLFNVTTLLELSDSDFL